MTEPSELVERLAAVVDPRFSDEFVGNIVRANWPDIHAALSAMADPLALPADVYDFVSKAGLLATNHGGWFDKHGFKAISPMCDWATRILEKYQRAAIDLATLEASHARTCHHGSTGACSACGDEG